MAIKPERYIKVYQYLNKIAPLSEKSWFDICQLFSEKMFEKNDFFAQEGRKEYKAGILLDGIFRSYIYSENDTEFTKTLYTPIYYKTPISFLGAYTSLVTGNPSSVNLQAITNAKTLICSYSDLNNLAEKNSEVKEWSLTLSNLFFMGKEKRVLELATMTATERYELFVDQFPELVQEINQYYIAQYIGVTPTQLSRIKNSR